MPPLGAFSMIIISPLSNTARPITYDLRSSYPSSEQSRPSCSGTSSPALEGARLLRGSTGPTALVSTTPVVELAFDSARGYLSHTARKLVMIPFPTVLIAAAWDFHGDCVPVNAMRTPGGDCQR